MGTANPAAGGESGRQRLGAIIACGLRKSSLLFPVSIIIIVMIGVLLNNANMNACCVEFVDLIKAFSDKQDANLTAVVTQDGRFLDWL